MTTTAGVSDRTWTFKPSAKLEAKANTGVGVPAVVTTLKFSANAIWPVTPEAELVMDGAACGDSSNWRHHHAVSGDRTPMLNKQASNQATDLHGTVGVLGLQLRDQLAPVTGVQAQREGLRQACVSESRRQGTVRSSGPPVLPRKPITSVDSTATSDPTQPHTALVRRGWVAVTGATLLHVRHAVEEGVVQQQLKHAASSTGSEARESVRHDRASSTSHVVGDGQHVAWPRTTTLAQQLAPVRGAHAPRDR